MASLFERTPPHEIEQRIRVRNLVHCLTIHRFCFQDFAFLEITVSDTTERVTARRSGLKRSVQKRPSVTAPGGSHLCHRQCREQIWEIWNDVQPCFKLPRRIIFQAGLQKCITVAQPCFGAVRFHSYHIAKESKVVPASVIVTDAEHGRDNQDTGTDEALQPPISNSAEDDRLSQRQPNQRQI